MDVIKQRFNLSSILMLALWMLILAAGCGGGSSSSSEDLPQSVATYNGPGSKWDVDLRSDNSFTIERRASMNAPVDMTVSGTYTELDSGFLTLTVESAVGEDAPAQGDTAWALDVPGYAFFLKPDDDPDGRFIAMVEAGRCPEQDMLGNWVVIRTRVGADATEADLDSLGTFAFDAVNQTANLPSRYALTDGLPDLGSADLEGGNCVDGVMSVDDAEMYLTANGGSLVHTNISDPDESHIIFTMPSQSIDTIDALDADYVGLLFDESSNVNANALVPVQLSCTAGLCAGSLFAEPEMTTELASFSVNLFGSIDQPEPGFVSGTLEADNELGRLVCLVSTDLGTDAYTLMSCVGQAPGNNSALINLMLRTS